MYKIQETHWRGCQQVMVWRKSQQDGRLECAYIAKSRAEAEAWIAFAMAANAPEAFAMILDLAVFAARFRVSAKDAYVLPTLFKYAAAKVDMAPRALVAEATYRNRALGEHMADLARKVAEADRVTC